MTQNNNDLLDDFDNEESQTSNNAFKGTSKTNNSLVDKRVESNNIAVEQYQVMIKEKK